MLSGQMEFVSCIKISGIPILPPLITEERSKELNEDRVKAIEIEKKLKQKRNSIDSGVMTGSYIDSIKHSEVQDIEHLYLSQFPISVGTSNNNGHDNKDLSVESNRTSNDSFLKAALEDTEFREFFCSTAEKIFKDNMIVNLNSKHMPQNVVSVEYDNAENVTCTGIMETRLSETSITTLPNDQLDPTTCSHLSLISSCPENNHTPKYEEIVSEIVPTYAIKDVLNPPQRLVRRNSYTLENPSTVLLEHLEKENVNSQFNKWFSLSDKKEKSEPLGFKTFSSVKKPRKTWNKKIPDHSNTPKADHSDAEVSMFQVKRSDTFVKDTVITASKDYNYSLPCSSRTSPIHLPPFAHSVDCIQSVFGKRQDTVDSSLGYYFNSSNGTVMEVNTPKNAEFLLSALVDCKNIVDKGANAESTMSNISNISMLNNTSSSVKSNSDMCTVFPPHYDPSDSASYTSEFTQSTFFEKKQIPSTNIDSKKCQFKIDQPSELEDSVSICSSLSLSKFMPLEDGSSQQSTVEDLTELFSELQLEHEQQIAKLLEKQHQEKIMLSRLHSLSNSTQSSRSATNLNIFEIPHENNSESLCLKGEKRSSCNRELFPTNNNFTSTLGQSKVQKYNTEVEKAAALKLTSCVRGYLTRRLLKTEKVQQLIDVIKESLNCAFSLQCEANLQKKDLELHDRLAHQLSAALIELQSIISAPVGRRMAIIAADREKLRKPLSRPSSAISTATRKSILRRQRSASNIDKAKEDRARTKTLGSNTNTDLVRSPSFAKSDSSGVSVSSANNSRKPWR